MARLSNQEVFERAQNIRKDHAELGTSVRELSLKFGVGSFFIKEILENKRNVVKPSPKGNYKTHTDYPNYLFYESGQIYSVFRNSFLSPTPNHNKYLMVKLYKEDGTHHNSGVHRITCRVYHGEPKHEDLQAKHLDGDNQNNHKDNLGWGTVLDNMGDQVTHGTRLKGREISSAKLTDKIVRRMRKKYISSGVSKNEFSKQYASKYGMSVTNFIGMLSGRTWKHVSTKYCVKSSGGCKSQIEKLPREKVDLILQRREEFNHLPRKKFARMVATKLTDQGFTIGTQSVYKFLKDLGI